MRGGARQRRRSPISQGLLALGLLALASAPAFAGGPRSALARADAAWELRAEGGNEEGRASRASAAAAVAAYQAAVDATPASLEPRWKLVRALYFAADYADGAPGEAVRQLERATRESELGLDLLAARLGVSGSLDSFEPRLRAGGLTPEEVSDAAGTFFWSAVVWGAWSQHHSTVDAVRAGVADRLYQAALAVIALDPGFEEGGAHRLLARVHVQVPRIPFLTGWVDPDLAVPAAERALALAPAHPANRFLLALTLLDVAPERRAEAVLLLEETARSEPRPGQHIEDLAVRRAARERLAQELAAEPAFALETAAGG